MIALSVFTLPFNYRETPFDYLIVCLILLNIVALMALFSAYIQFKVRPPHPKFNIRGIFDYLKEFATGRNDFIIFTLFADFVVVSVYALYLIVILLHFAIFE